MVTDSIDTSDSSGSKANVAFIKSLIDLQYAITVLHYTQKDLKIEGATCISIQVKKFNALYLLGGIQRVIQRRFHFNLSTFLENLFGFSFTYFNDCKSIKASLNKYDRQQFDLIVTLSIGESYRPHYTLLKTPIWHEIWVAYIHDPYPFQNYPQPYTFFPKGGHQKHDFFKKVTKSCFKAGFPSLFLAYHMKKFYPCLKGKSIVLPHQYDSNVQRDPEPIFLEKDAFNLVHAGNLLDGRSPKGLLEGFKLFLEKYPEYGTNCYLYLVGYSGSYSKLINSFDHYKQIVHHSNVDYSCSLTLQYNASVNIILEASKTDFSPFLPAKMAHCVMVDRPILALSPEKSEVRRLLTKSYPYQCPADDPIAISEIIALLYKRWKENPTINRSLNRFDLQTYFSSEYLGKQINKIIYAAP